jgi:cysteine desulfurase
MKRLYLDHHATTPVDPRVLEVMLPYLHEEFGNPSSSTHPFGWAAQEAVEKARAQVAALIGATAKEIVFTSGATESNNIAILGAAAAAPPGRTHLITQATEHHAVLDPLRQLERRGFRLTILAPDGEGRIDPAQVEAEISEQTLLVSIMAAQNEVGTLEPLAAIGALARRVGALFHTDAAQAAGKIPLNVESAGIDLLSISAHKYHGPKGCGALFVRRRGTRVRLSPLAFGGGQEGGLRPGTLNVPGIAGLGEASRIAALEMEEEAVRLRRLRERLHETIRAGIPDVRLNGPAGAAERLPGNLSLSFPRVDGTALIVGLKDIAVSSGSACTTGSPEPSYVLRAIGVPPDLAVSTLRLGLGRFTTEEEVDIAAARIVETVRKLRGRR